MAGKFQIMRTITGKYYFNLVTDRGRIVLSSEVYETKERAKWAIEAIKNLAFDANRYERRTSFKGEPYFILKAANGMEIGRSEIYHSTTAMENGIAAVRDSVRDAEILSLAN